MAAVVAATTLSAPASAAAPEGAELRNAELVAGFAERSLPAALEPGPGFAMRGVREDGPSTSPPNAERGGKARRVGRWLKGRKGVVDLPTFAIGAVMLPTGKVLFWGYPPQSADGANAVNSGRAALWNPRKGSGRKSVTRIDPPAVDPDGEGPQGSVPAPLYGASQSLLPNGAALVAGGNRVWPDQYPDDEYSNNAGLETAFTFDPFAERWIRQPDLASGRWQGSQVLLGDGRTAILGGVTDAPSPVGTGPTPSDRAEVFIAPRRSGGKGRFETAGRSSAFATSLNPHLVSIPDGRVAMFGPGYWETSRFDFDPAIELPDRAYGADATDGRSRFGGTVVPEPSGVAGSQKALQLGGYDDTRPTAEDEGIFEAIATSTWLDGLSLETTAGASARLARSWANTVLLPDGSMATVGGGRGRGFGYANYYTDDDTALKRVELYDPKSERWTLGPSQREYRTYNSVALLLPDGRVWSAGDDYHEVTERGGSTPFGPSTGDTAEIYRPPYLYKPGARPKIKRVPATVGYGDTFGIRTKKGQGRKAVMVAPGATTHSVDTQQRVVTLRKVGKVKGKGLNVRTPEAGGVTPPGYYMLFVLRGNGKPSVAKWVRLSHDAGDDTDPLR